MGWKAGDYCRVDYKSGTYVARFVEKAANSPRAVVQIVAVLEHPYQGDLHNPYETNVPLFHERKAAAFGEQVLIPLGLLERYDGAIPDYHDSLQQAYKQLYAMMQARGDDYGARSLERLDELASTYGFT